MTIFTISIHVLFIIFLILSIRNDNDRIKGFTFILFFCSAAAGILLPFKYVETKAENSVTTTIDNKKYAFIFENGEAKSRLFFFQSDMEIVKTETYSLYGLPGMVKFEYQKTKQ